MDWTEIIAKLIESAAQVLIFGVAAHRIQKSIDNGAAKRIEEFKSTLKVIESKEGSLHSKRLEVIEAMYKKIVELDYAMRTLVSPIKYGSDNESSLILKADEKFRDFNMFFETNTIYFLPKTCKEIDVIRRTFYDGLVDYNQPVFLKSMNVEDKEVLREAMIKANEVYKSVKDKIPVLRGNIEIEFREILSGK
ncbi:MAG: hypothetical protein JST75_14950 [Bacteroidetes bacterium]|nr:hypothetical protein [Bacteroidota bacterium]